METPMSEHASNLLSAATSPAPASTAGKTVGLVLLVEDDQLTHRLVRKMLHGHEVLVAETVSQAMTQLRKNPMVDLAVVDYLLRGEQGSSFVAELRRHAFCRDLPVIAYTSAQDRDVVMRYADYGVQAFHIKPYKAEVLQRELEVAMRSGRRDRLLEPTQAACRRLKISEHDYAGLLNSGAAMLEKDLQTVRRLLLTSNSQELHSALHNVAHRLPQMGVKIAGILASQATQELAALDYHACTETIAVLDSVVSLVRRRAMELLALGDSIVSASAPKTKTERRASVVDSSGVPAHLRAVLSQSIGVLGSRTDALGGSPLLSGGQLSLGASSMAMQPPMEPWLLAIRRLDTIDEATIEVTAGYFAEITGYERPMRDILLRSEVAKPHELNVVKWPTIVSKLGVAKAMVFVAAGMVGRCMARSPLDLQDLRLRVVAMALLGYEMGRFLRVTHPHRIAGAAIARASGEWILGNSEPVTMALVLARAAHLRDLEQAQIDLLGGTLNAAAGQWLKTMGLPILYQDSAAGATSDKDSMITVALVCLAERLASVAVVADPAAVTACRDSLADPASWAELRELGVQPPVEPAEAADLLMTLARSAAWMAGEIVNA